MASTKPGAVHYGSGTLGYRGALSLATIATLAGGLLSVWLAQNMAQTFSGNGLISGGSINDALLLAASAVMARDWGCSSRNGSWRLSPW
ncbi:MAG: hypothetical protein LT080_10870 [Thiobacillus sp.]|nr:hypothetical protein [Thiobacillus sp.]